MIVICYNVIIRCIKFIHFFTPTSTRVSFQVRLQFSSGPLLHTSQLLAYAREGGDAVIVHVLQYLLPHVVRQLLFPLLFVSFVVLLVIMFFSSSLSMSWWPFPRSLMTCMQGVFACHTTFHLISSVSFRFVFVLSHPLGIAAQRSGVSCGLRRSSFVFVAQWRVAS